MGLFCPSLFWICITLRRGSWSGIVDNVNFDFWFYESTSRMIRRHFWFCTVLPALWLLILRHRLDSGCVICPECDQNEATRRELNGRYLSKSFRDQCQSISFRDQCVILNDSDTSLCLNHSGTSVCLYHSETSACLYHAETSACLYHSETSACL